VRVTVRLFAGLREHAGWSEREVDAGRVGDVWRAIGLGSEPAGLLYAVNRSYVDRNVELAEGDVVAVIPPVSGGAFRLSADALSVERVIDEVTGDGVGAVATFVGVVRGRSRGHKVVYLDYEAYEGMAEEMMEQLALGLAERYTLNAVAIHHRIGRVDVGKPSVVVAVSAAHRADALAACRDAIDALKSEVPLWKKEVYESGSEWIGTGS
jgi:MoaE-MoaD fusion protein